MNLDTSINLATLAVVVGGFIKFYGDLRETRMKVNAMWSVFMRQYGTRASDKSGDHSKRKM